MKRYDIRIDCYAWDAYKLDITIEDDGNWCKYSDVAALVAEDETLRNDAREMAKALLWSNDPKKTITSHWNRCSCKACTIARKYQTGGE